MTHKRQHPVFFEEIEQLSDSLLDRKPATNSRHRDRKTSCELCGFDKTCKSPRIPMTAYKGADLLLWGDSPSGSDDEKGKPFIGLAGKLLRTALNDYDLLHRSAFSSIIQCRPPSNKTSSPSSIKLCGDQHCWQDIDRLKPKLSVLLGATAIQYFLGNKSIDHARCTVHEVNGHKFIATIHPAFILHSPEAKRLYAVDFKKVTQVLLGGTEKEFKFDYITSVEDSKAFLTSITNCDREISFDIETVGVKTFSDTYKIVCAGFYDGVNRPVCIDWENIDKELFNKFTNSKTKKIMHAGKFDVLGTVAKMQSRWRNFYFDTQAAWYALDETQGFSRLENLAWELVEDCYGWKHMVENYITDMSKCPLLLRAEYVCKDVYYTKLIKDKIVKRTEEIGVTQLTTFITQCMVTFSYIQANGAKIDEKFLEQALKEVSEKEEEYRQEFLRFAEKEGVKELNINSNTQLKKLFFEQLKLPVLKLTESKQPALDKEVLPMYEDKYPIMRALSYYRQCSRIKTTYLEALKANKGKDGIVHTSFNITKTVTGRSSSSDPINLQNIPRSRDEVETTEFNPYPYVKRCFISRYGDEGSIVEADFSQLELRVLCCLCKDEAMMKIFLEDGDIHGEVAKQLAGNANPTTEDRNRAKGINFGIAYGAGPQTVSESLRCSVEKAAQYIESWYAKFPRAREWMDETTKFLVRNGYVVSPLGRRRRLPIIYSQDIATRARAIREGINSVIQGTASDILLFCLSRIEKRMHKEQLKSLPIIPIHDSILTDVYDEEKEYVKSLITEMMENVPWSFIKAPLRIKLKEGKNWLETK